MAGHGWKSYAWGNQHKIAAILLLPIALAACAGSDDGRSITYTDDRGVSNQPYPNNYRAEVLAFMKTYLNNPVGVHDAAMAEPVQRVIGGRLRYVTCLRYSRVIPTATTASRASARSSMSMAGSIVWSRTPPSPAPARSMLHSRNCRA